MNTTRDMSGTHVPHLARFMCIQCEVDELEKSMKKRFQCNTNKGKSCATREIDVSRHDKEPSC
jgi:hypothetical protein